jgi:hypothetical protein
MELIDKVIEQIVEDIDSGNTEALSELLLDVPVSKLIGYLSELKQLEYAYN